MRVLPFVLCATLTLGGCAGYGGHGGGYDAYYDGAYGPFYDGYWDGDSFMYSGGRGRPFIRDGGGHFQHIGGAGFHGVHGRGGGHGGGGHGPH
jgi:hypothetical protein